MKLLIKIILDMKLKEFKPVLWAIVRYAVTAILSFLAGNNI